MKAKSLDLRFRILETFDEGKWTQEAATKRFRFSHRLFKKLIMQRKRTGQRKVKARMRLETIRSSSRPIAAALAAIAPQDAKGWFAPCGNSFKML
jgi:hypothetical protein